MRQFPPLSASTLAAINTVGQWLAQNDFAENITVQTDCVILAGNAVIPTIDAACRIAKEQQVPLLISGGIGHSTTFCMPPSQSIHATTRFVPLVARKRRSLPISRTSSGTFLVRRFG